MSVRSPSEIVNKTSLYSTPLVVRGILNFCARIEHAGRVEIDPSFIITID